MRRTIALSAIIVICLLGLTTAVLVLAAPADNPTKSEAVFADAPKPEKPTPPDMPTPIEAIEQQGGKVYLPGPKTDPTDASTALGYVLVDERIDPETNTVRPVINVYDVKTNEVIGVQGLNIGFVPNSRLDDPGYDVYAEVERAIAEDSAKAQEASDRAGD
jgi:hypothetical protein